MSGIINTVIERLFVCLVAAICFAVGIFLVAVFAFLAVSTIHLAMNAIWSFCV